MVGDPYSGEKAQEVIKGNRVYGLDLAVNKSDGTEAYYFPKSMGIKAMPNKLHTHGVDSIDGILERTFLPK